MKLIKWFKSERDSRAQTEVAELLPLYLNNTLSADEAGTVEAWLHQDHAAARELAAWRQVQEVVTDEPAEAPPLAVYERVRRQIRSRPARRSVPWLPRLAWGTAVGLAVLVLLWLVLQPGIVLDWSVQGDRIAAFRIYRAPLGTADFGLVGEVPAEPEIGNYRYVDARPWLARAYDYRVEALGAAGQPVLSQATSTSALEALPAQLAVVLLALCAGVGASCFSRQRRFRSLSVILWSAGGAG